MTSSAGWETCCISVAAGLRFLRESASPDESDARDDVNVSPNQKPSTDKPAPVRPRGWAGRFRPHADDVDDRTVAGLLAYHALIEIRSSAGKSRRQPETASTDEVLERIRFLADLAHNLPLVARPQGRWRPSRPGLISRRDRAMQTRPMSWTWNTSGERGREWILRHIAQAGYRWTPPPPLPAPRKDAAAWNLRQGLRVLAGWPVRTPPGRQPLPRQARILKALDRDQMYALYEEAGSRRLGMGSASPELRAHLDPNAPHYLFPDPADYYWPNEDRPWWECRVLLRMVDGEPITGSLTVLPETFTALPSTVSGIRQRRLALTARMLERDYYLWWRDHEKDCSPQRCGYPAEPTA
ncbi:hypothetical protein GCM10011608_61170 [Micromonospora sonchi]|uniref:Uncharacterized protein n=2 Tax=Micromonospora sonchi TaxID=1763543 RepID=A0A917U967_9ACTN|nr:hypothetical protein GCM10011608_61170 [Micromonospora sonchi]